MLPALAGANLIYGLGLLELGMTVNYPQLIIDADIASMILYSLRGIPVNDDTLSVDAINQVGSFKDFLTHRSTFTHRNSQSQPKLIDRKNIDAWTTAGSLSMTERATEKAKWILENHKPTPVPEKAKLAMREIIRRVEKEKGLPLSED